MKLTVKNLLENWDNVKGQLSDRIVKAYEAGVPDALPYYDDPEFAEIVDMFLKDANEELAAANTTKRKYGKGKSGKVTGKRAKGTKKEAPKSTKRKYGKGKSGKVTGKRAKGTKKEAQKSTKRKYGKGKSGKVTGKRAKGTEKVEMPADVKAMKPYLNTKKKHPDAVVLMRVGDFYEAYGQDAVEVSSITGHILTKTSKFKNTEGKSLSMVAIPHTDFNKAKRTIVDMGLRVAVMESAKSESTNKDSKSKSKSETTKTTKKAKTSNRPLKSSYARAPYWYKILEGFCGLAGKNKETWRIQNYLDYIQDSCASERKRNTPFIEVIREIQDCLLKYANVDRKEKPKQTLPAWTTLVKKCKDGMKSITISTKTGASPFWSKAGLAGFGIQKWYIAFQDTRGFKKLDDAKKYIRHLSATARKRLSVEKSYIYRSTDNKMDRIVDFKCYGKNNTARFSKMKSC